MSELTRVIEAILFVSDAPVTTEELAEVAERSTANVADALKDLSLIHI